MSSWVKETTEFKKLLELFTGYAMSMEIPFYTDVLVTGYGNNYAFTVELPFNEIENCFIKQLPFQKFSLVAGIGSKLFLRVHTDIPTEDEGDFGSNVELFNHDQRNTLWVKEYVTKTSTNWEDTTVEVVNFSETNTLQLLLISKDYSSVVMEADRLFNRGFSYHLARNETTVATCTYEYEDSEKEFINKLFYEVTI